MPKRKSTDSDLPDISGEPEGWRLLQERARSERDPRKLEVIIAEMNQLLKKCENQALADNGLRRPLRRGGSKQNH